MVCLVVLAKSLKKTWMEMALWINASLFTIGMEMLEDEPLSMVVS